MSYFIRRSAIVFAALPGLAVTTRAPAATVALLPSQWNLISSVSQTNSDGSGYHTFVGGGREGLLQFNFSAIPAGASITSATLTMYMDRSQASSPPSQPIFVYRLTSSWGMGTSGANQVDNGIASGGGTGYAPTNNDATWNNRFYNAAAPGSSIPWTKAGGDFATSASASSLVGSGTATTGTPGAAGPLLSTWSGAGLAADVQTWLTGAYANDGWLLSDYASSADDPPSGNAFASDQPRRFITPANNLNGAGANPDDRPYLMVTYSVPEAASLGLLLAPTALLLRRRKAVKR